MRALDEAQQVNMAESADAAEVSFLMTNATKPPFDNQDRPVGHRQRPRSSWATRSTARASPSSPTGPSPPGRSATSRTPACRGDQERARELVEQYEAETGQTFRFQITSTPEPDTLAAAQFAAQMFEEAGMDVSITSLDQSSLISSAISKDFQLMTFRNYPGLDPDNNYVWWYGGGNPVNFSGFDDPDVNRLLDAGRATPDPAARQEIYGELNRVLAARATSCGRRGRHGRCRWTRRSTAWWAPARRTGAATTGLALGHDMAYVWKEQ